jgi:hypothetical protein
MEIQLLKVLLETDGSRVMAKLKKDEMGRSSHDPLVERVKELLISFRDASVHVVRRSVNQSAHVLAEEGCKIKMCMSRLGDPPASLVKTVVSDV